MKWVTPLVNKQVLTSMGVSLYLRKLVLDGWQCLAITPKWDKITYAGTTFVGVAMAIDIDFPSNKPSTVWSYVAITSEENLFGFGRWYDGFSKKISINRAEELHITTFKVTEYHQFESLCSEESYYQCLAKRFINLDYKKMGTSPVDCAEEHSFETITRNCSQKL